MAYRWAEGSKPNPVLESVMESVSLSDGAVGILRLSVHGDIAVLASMLQGQQADDGIDRVDLIWDVLHGINAPISATKLLSLVNVARSAQRKGGLKKFSLITTLSTDGAWLPRSLQICELRARFLKTLPRKFKSARVQLVKEQIRTGIIHQDLDSYSFVQIDVEAESAGAAFAKSDRELRILRGLICLLSNPSFEKTLLGSEHKPINVLRTGHFHTIHNTDGSVATDLIWYEPNYSPRITFTPRKPSVLVDVLKKTLRRMRNCPYNGRLEQAVIRFASGFDESDPDAAFLKCWSALESILSSNVADYKQLVRRCIFLYEDRDYHESILKQLAEHRNASVHRVSDNSLTKSFCYLLQNYFATTLNFHIRNYTRFSNFEEALTLLSGPVSQSDVNAAMARALFAKRFLAIKP